MDGFITLITIIGIIWGILNIILFFKVWGMTEDIRALKNDYFNDNEIVTSSSLRKNYILGDMDKVKKMLLNDFMDEVESAYAKKRSSVYDNSEIVNDFQSSYNERVSNESIRPYIEKLQKQFSRIGKEVPEYITRLETFNDYYSLFVEKNTSESKESIRFESQSSPSTEITEEVVAQLADSSGERKSSNSFLYDVIIPIIIAAVFLIGVIIFHVNYSYTDWWVEESAILTPAFIVFAFILVLYFVVVRLKNEKRNRVATEK